MTAANKAFVIVTILGPFLIVAMSVLPSLLSMRGTVTTTEIAVIGAEREFLGEIRPVLEQVNISIVDRGEDQEQLDRAVLDGEIKGYLVLPDNLLEASSLEYVSSTSTEWQLAGTLQGVIGESIVARRLGEAGLDPVQIGRLTRRPDIAVKKISKKGGRESRDFMTDLFSGLAFTFLLYMTVLLYGQAIGRSVVTEKTSKTVEIMLSSVHPRDLLLGKLLGKAGASLVQYAVWIGMAVVFLKILAPVIGVSIPVVGGASTFLFLLLFFLLAYFLYSAMYAALGAASEDEQHMGQMSFPLIFFLVIPMVAIGAIISNPDSPVVIGLSYFPLTAPIVMFQRIVMGNPKPLGIAVCSVILLISIVFVMLVSAKIFRVGILMTGKRFKLKEILRWMRYN